MSKAISITVYKDADVLRIWLEQVCKDPSIKDYIIVLHCDVGYAADEVAKVIHWITKTYGDLNIIVNKRKRSERPPCLIKGYYNILRSYIDTAQMHEVTDYIIIGEPDIIPTDDYLRFNEYVYQNYLKKYDRIFCCAHKRRPEGELQGDPELLIGDTQCTSPMCVTVDNVLKYMVNYQNDPMYWSDPISYNATYFSNSRIRPNEHTHHDGAIERIIEAHGLFTLKPDQARSLHVGLEGVFCGGQAPTGSVFERYEQYKSLIKQGGDAIRARSMLPQDIVVVPLEGPEWSELRLDLDRDQAKASSWWYDPDNKFKEYINEVDHAVH